MKQLILALALLASASTAAAAKVSKMVIQSKAQSVPLGQCSGVVRVQAQSNASVATAVSRDTLIYFTGSGKSLKFYTDATCSIAVSKITMRSGKSQAGFYFKGTTTGAQPVVVATMNYMDDRQTATILNTAAPAPAPSMTPAPAPSPTATPAPVATPVATPTPTPSSAPTAPVTAGRAVPSPLYGVTLDDVSNVSAQVTSLQSLSQMPTTRVVFDGGVNPSYYTGPVQKLRAVSYIMGQILDSTEMGKQTVAQYQQRTQSYVDAMNGQVDIWEIGNEVNGGWLSKNTQAQIRAAYNVVTAAKGATAVTFFYEGEPTDAKNCIDKANGGNDMFTWIRDNFQLNLPPEQRDPENEKVRLGLTYALISWYPQQCNDIQPNWSQIYAKLAEIFPNSKVGFGEIGTESPQNGSAYEVNLIKQFYPMAKTTQMPASYIGGYFWWYYAEEMVPSTKTPLFNILNDAIK